MSQRLLCHPHRKKQTRGPRTQGKRAGKQYKNPREFKNANKSPSTHAAAAAGGRGCSPWRSLLRPQTLPARYLRAAIESRRSAAIPLQILIPATSPKNLVPPQISPSTAILGHRRRHDGTESREPRGSVAIELARRSSAIPLMCGGTSEACPAWGEEAAKKPPSLRPASLPSSSLARARSAQVRFAAQRAHCQAAVNRPPLARTASNSYSSPSSQDQKLAANEPRAPRAGERPKPLHTGCG